MFTYTLCPSYLFHAGYASSLTAVLATGLSLIFLFLGGALVLLLWLVEMRHKRVVGEAALSNAIVSSLFPASVRKRLFADRGALLPNEINTDGRQSRRNLRQFLSRDFSVKGSDGAILTKAPIADLFPGCTIMFADLVGFTSCKLEESVFSPL